MQILLLTLVLGMAASLFDAKIGGDKADVQIAIIEGTIASD